MLYISTRDNHKKVSASEAIKTGMVPRGGLFVPERTPRILQTELSKMTSLAYHQLAETILCLYLTDFSQSEIKECTLKAYNQNNFHAAEIAPLYKYNDNTYILELWHGPTAAFKDMALQIMPHLLSHAVKKLDSQKEIVILVATSGDTGKAALEGFKDVEGLKIIVFYPYQGVSKVQELQMTTTEGKNTIVVSIEGNFDDCQNTVKDVFADSSFNKLLQEKNYELSSANSINWGRLVPQIVYYFWAYLCLLEKGEIKENEKINFSVPTGNFGNILAGYYAFLMGLPINKLICASNENNILTDFINTGKYDMRRDFKKTNSPSMDILISSNLERFLFEITGHDGEKISDWFQDLKTKRCFEVDKETLEKIQEIMVGNYATEKETLSNIREAYCNHNYLIDTHTAVGVRVLSDYTVEEKDGHLTVAVSTANPYKFNSSVLEALKGKEEVLNKDEFEILEELEEYTGMEIHPGLKDLDSKQVKHNQSCKKENIREQIKKILSI